MKLSWHVDFFLSFEIAAAKYSGISWKSESDILIHFHLLKHTFDDTNVRCWIAIAKMFQVSFRGRTWVECKWDFDLFKSPLFKFQRNVPFLEMEAYFKNWPNEMTVCYFETFFEIPAQRTMPLMPTLLLWVFHWNRLLI